MKPQWTAALVTSCLFLSSCGEGSTATGAHSKSHDYDPMHGGDVVHLGDHKPMVELRHDEAAGEVHLWSFDAHHEVMKLPSAPKLHIDAETVVTATGADAVWVFRDAALKEHLHGLEVEVEIWERGEKKAFRKGWHPSH